MTTTVVVARAKPQGLEYMVDGARGVWSEASQSAAQFTNLREATRAAMRLPSQQRAFALPIVH